jgi:hypothetical protein
VGAFRKALDDVLRAEGRQAVKARGR